MQYLLERLETRISFSLLSPSSLASILPPKTCSLYCFHELSLSRMKTTFYFLATALAYLAPVTQAQEGRPECDKPTCSSSPVPYCITITERFDNGGIARWQCSTGHRCSSNMTSCPASNGSGGGKNGGGGSNSGGGGGGTTTVTIVPGVGGTGVPDDKKLRDNDKPDFKGQKNDKGSPLGMIVGGVVGAIVLIVVVFFAVKALRSRNEDDEMADTFGENHHLESGQVNSNPQATFAQPPAVAAQPPPPVYQVQRPNNPPTADRDSFEF